MSSEAARHLRERDATLGAVVDRVGPLALETDDQEAFASLARAIVFQQLAGSAARAIWDRLVDRLGGDVTPGALADASDGDLRDVGLSARKVGYLRDLARHVQEGDLDPGTLPHLGDEEVKAALTDVRGIGPWTAEMFLMFHLGREDVFSPGDLGLRRAMEDLYDLPEDASPAAYEEVAERWRPYRTYACLYLWRWSDGDVDGG